MSPPDIKLTPMLSMVNTILELSSVHSVITGCNLAPVGTGANLASVGTGCNLALAIFSIANFFFFGDITRAKYR